MWASGADRDRAIRILKESFVAGRLAFDEFEERVGRAIGARDFGELLTLYDDLPVGLCDRLPHTRSTRARPSARSAGDNASRVR